MGMDTAGFARFYGYGRCRFCTFLSVRPCSASIPIARTAHPRPENLYRSRMQFPARKRRASRHCSRARQLTQRDPCPLGARASFQAFGHAMHDTWRVGKSLPLENAFFAPQNAPKLQSRAVEILRAARRALTPAPHHPVLRPVPPRAAPRLPRARESMR